MNECWKERQRERDTHARTHTHMCVSWPLPQIFSPRRLEREELDLLVLNIKEESIRVVEWQAYPRSSPPEAFTPFVLDDGALYANLCSF